MMEDAFRDTETEYPTTSTIAEYVAPGIKAFRLGVRIYAKKSAT